MKRIKVLLISSLIISLSFFSYSQSFPRPSFTIADSFGIVKQYTIDEAFLRSFAQWTRMTVPQEYKEWYSDIYKAMSNGTSITYNRDNNTISGMQGKWHVNDKGLEADQSRNRKFFQSMFNSTPHQFRVALQYLKYFDIAS